MNKKCFLPDHNEQKSPADLPNGAKHSSTILLVCIKRKNVSTSKLDFARVRNYSSGLQKTS